jgi:C-terminal processing protease CtpA/Prc
MKTFLVQRWLKSLAALSLGGMMIAAPALGQGSKADPPKSPAAEAAKDKEKDAPKPPAPATPSNANPKSDDKSPPTTPTPPSGTTPSSSAGSGNSAGNSGNDKETPRRPDTSPATPATPGNTNAKENQPNRDTKSDSPRDTTNPNRDTTTPNRNDRDTNRDANTDRAKSNDSNTTRDNDRRDADRRDTDRRDVDRRDGDRRDTDRRDTRAGTDRRDNATVSTKVRTQAISTLGLQVNAATQGSGLTISTVRPNSVFATAGFRTNDVILRVGDRRFNDDVVFYNWLATVRPNQRVAIVVLRDGREETINWTPTEQWIEEYTTVTKEVAVPGNANALGIYLDPQVQDAAVVAEVEPNSAAHKAGVQRNDYIDAVNGERVRSPQDFQALTANIQAANTELTLSRQMKVQLGAANNQSSSSSSTLERRDTRINAVTTPAATPNVVPAPPQPATGPAVDPVRPTTPAVPPRGEGRPGILPRNR